MFFCFLKQMKDVHLTHADFEDAISLDVISWLKYSLYGI